MIPFALVGLEGWLLVGPILLLWIVLVRNLWKLSKSLDRAGYALTPAPVRLSSGAAFGLWLGIPALALAILPPAFSRLPVRGTTPVYGPSVRDEALEQKLLDLGFPEDLLIKLDSGQMSMLQGAYGLTVKGYDSLFDVGPYPDGIPGLVMFEVPVRDERYGFRTVYLAYLRWSPEEMSGSGYMEGVKVTPDWQGVSVHASTPQGKLEWRDGDGVYHEAPLSFHFRAGSSASSYFSDFSLPREADGPVEGWVIWDLAPSYPESPRVFNYQISLAHRLTAWQYPYTLPSDVLASEGSRAGWRINGQRAYTGQMAPEGQYQPEAYGS